MALGREAILARQILRSLQQHNLRRHTEALGACSTSYGDVGGRPVHDPAAHAASPLDPACSRGDHGYPGRQLAGGLHAGKSWIHGSARSIGGCKHKVGLGMEMGGLGVQHQIRTMVLGFGDGDEDKDHARHHQEERVIGLVFLAPPVTGWVASVSEVCETLCSAGGQNPEQVFLAPLTIVCWTQNVCISEGLSHSDCKVIPNAGSDGREQLGNQSWWQYCSQW